MKQPVMTECNCKSFDSNFDFQHESRKIVPVKDKGKPTEYRYHNKSSYHLAKYRVDGGLIEEGAKYDYLLLNCEQRHAYFIELKGSDIIHAIEQIDKSVDVLKGNLTDFAFFARIVLTRDNTTKLNITNKLQNLEKKLLNGNLKKQSRLLEEYL